MALLTTDGRAVQKDYDSPAPHFGTAVDSLMQGFAQMPEIEVHIVSCLRKKAQAPPKPDRTSSFIASTSPRLAGCGRATGLHPIGSQEARAAPTRDRGTAKERRRSCAISAAFSGFPNVVTLHGIMRLIARVEQAKPFSFLWLAARLEAFTLPRSDGVVCISSHTQRAVTSLARRTWVVPNAVDPSFLQNLRSHEQDGQPRILCVARVCALEETKTD